MPPQPLVQSGSVEGGELVGGGGWDTGGGGGGWKKEGNGGRKGRDKGAREEG